MIWINTISAFRLENFGLVLILLFHQLVKVTLLSVWKKYYVSVLCRTNLLLNYSKKYVCNFLDKIDFGSFFQGKDQFREVSWVKEHSCFVQEEFRWNGNMASIFPANLSFSHQWLTWQFLDLEGHYNLLPCSLVVVLI